MSVCRVCHSSGKVKKSTVSPQLQISALSQICFFWILVREKEIHYLARIKKEIKKSMRSSETIRMRNQVSACGEK